MNSLQQLRSGELTGTSRLSMACGLETFPREIFDLCDTLEILDLSNNRLRSLPDDFGRLAKLRILFLSFNAFETVPEVLADCPDLSMIGFKSNIIEEVPEHSLPRNVRWLILTDNRIETLPESLGECTALQKLMLAGNRITRLPDSMAACRNLELIRLSANHIEALPHWLFTLPRLAWFACAGNPCVAYHPHRPTPLDTINWNELHIREELGTGASGVIFRANRPAQDADVAVKLFKGDITSDGYPSDEMHACMSAGSHDNLTTLHGKLSGHPEEKEGLILSLIPPTYTNLGNPPDFDTCTRDTYDAGRTFSFSTVLRMATDIASAAEHLHARGVMHGDLYAHNILVDMSGHSLLGDFGAAFLYERSLYGSAFEHLEVRAYGLLLQELLDRCDAIGSTLGASAAELRALADCCSGETPEKRPLFAEISGQLARLQP